MPGIVGIISRTAQGRWEPEIEKMVGAMLHERFYVAGVYSCPEIGVYGGWVAHKHSFASSQTFLNHEGDVALVLSGECFLDPDTLALLRRRGHAVDPTRGTWLIPLYLEVGEPFFERLNGLFSGLLIDQRRRTAFLFNDRYGIERLYWHENDHAFYFASEAKALLRILPDVREFDNQGVAEFLRFGCTCGTRTLFRGISTVPPASRWQFYENNNARQKYFSPQKWESQSATDSTEFSTELEDTFRRILPRYFQADMPIGISLTAGLDGRLIMSCLPQTGRQPVCYTFSGLAPNLRDAQVAAKIAEACNLKHHVIQIRSNFFDEFASYADRTVFITDGCLGLLGTHELYFNKLARCLAPTRLTGVFGGEILREVSFFKPLHLSRELINRDYRAFLDEWEQQVSNDNLHPITTAVTREIPDRRFGVIAAGRSQTVFRTPYLDNELVALAYRTPPALLASPEPVISAIRKNSGRLSRIPTDMGLLGNNASIAVAMRKMLAKGTFKLDYIYTEGLPHSLDRLTPILDAFNTGALFFGRHKFLHYRRWFRQELAQFVSERIQDIAARGSELFDRPYLQKMLSEHVRGKVNYTKEINVVLTLDAVPRLLFQNITPEVKDLALSGIAHSKPIASEL